MRWAVFLLILAVFLLAIIGLVMIYSVSSVQGETIYNDSYHFVKNQGLFFLLAIMAIVLINLIPFDTLFSKEIVYLAIVIILFGLIAVHIPGLGRKVNGSSRWIELIGFRLQTSEFIKLATIFLMAWWQGQAWRKNVSFLEGFLYPTIGLGIVDIGLMSQPDFGSTFMLSAICCMMMVVAGVNLKYLLGMVICGLSLFVYKVIEDPLRLQRVNPIIKLNSSGIVDSATIEGPLYQVVSAISAFKHGGVWGKGLGHSVYKEHYIPEYHTDFILSMIGEEMGILGTSIIAILVLTILISGIYISLKERDFQFRLLAFGMTLQISLYAIVNTAVVIGFFPTKGLAMPFLSYGGSNLLSSFIAIGFIIFVARHVIGNEVNEEDPQHDLSFWKM